MVTFWFRLVYQLCFRNFFRFSAMISFLGFGFRRCVGFWWGIGFRRSPCYRFRGLMSSSAFSTETRIVLERVWGWREGVLKTPWDCRRADFCGSGIDRIPMAPPWDADVSISSPSLDGAIDPRLELGYLRKIPYALRNSRLSSFSGPYFSY